MREIKFRAWVANDSNTKSLMVNVTNISFMKNSSGAYLEECEGWYGDNNRIRFSLDKANLLEYTGIRDKNGKEIYEGDIVNWGDNYKSVIEWNADKYLEGDGWMIHEYYPRNEYDRYHTTSAYTNPIEVIGNIFENPELLKK